MGEASGAIAAAADGFAVHDKWLLKVLLMKAMLASRKLVAK